MNNPFSLENKTILVTGASSGIGKATAVECSGMGASVIVTGRDEKRLDETYSELKGNRNVKILSDLTDMHDFESLIEKLPVINGIVHCAGIADPVPFKFITREKLDNIFSINFFSPVLLSKELIKRKILLRDSSIVFISSISGTLCSSYAGGMYSATKGAVNGIVKGMALDLSPLRIRVNTVQPGMINTNIYKDEKISDQQLEEDRKRYPLGRYGEPHEVAYAVIFLLSDASKWMTGSNILIDGGYTLL